MPLILRNVTLAPGDPEERLPCLVAETLGIAPADIRSLRIVRKGIDARRKGRIRFVYSLRFDTPAEADLLGRHVGNPDLVAAPAAPPPAVSRVATPTHAVVAGLGPAGLFAALRLAEHGIAVTVLERGKPVADRVRDVSRFWARGELDPESNVQFGEGGAGTFSDGKLITRVNDANITYVLEQLVRFGAPEEILYLAKPHIGTDRLRRVVTNARLHLEKQGVQILFRHRLDDIALSGGLVRAAIAAGKEFPCDCLVVAPGHSARDTYELLQAKGVTLLPKPFAVGVRVEHPQELISAIQYGKPVHPALPPADYALAYNAPGGRSAYSFCMCPGGMVVASSSEAGGVVTNGMSNHDRSAPYANSALVVSVGPADFDGADALAGVRFQREWERRAFVAGGEKYRAPAQNLLSFAEGRGGRIRSSYRPGVVEADLATVLPSYVSETLREGLKHFDRKMRGFYTVEATLVGVETRTSAPLRIVRGDDYSAPGVAGLYPCGEGAGYAGGIMSAALDGIRVADAIAARLTADVEEK